MLAVYARWKKQADDAGDGPAVVHVGGNNGSEKLTQKYEARLLQAE